MTLNAKGQYGTQRKACSQQLPTPDVPLTWRDAKQYAGLYAVELEVALERRDVRTCHTQIVLYITGIGLLAGSAKARPPPPS